MTSKHVHRYRLSEFLKNPSYDLQNMWAHEVEEVCSCGKEQGKLTKRLEERLDDLVSRLQGL